MQCNSFTDTYVGKGLDRVKHSGHCVYEQGHDGSCCPPSLVNVDWVSVPKIELAQLRDWLAALTHSNLAESTGEWAALELVVALVASWPQP